MATLWFLVVLDVSVPADVGTWNPTALEGEVVYSLSEEPSGSLLAGTESGLYRVRADGSTRPVPAVPGPVYTLRKDEEEVYAGTAEGLHKLSSPGDSPRREGLADMVVRDLAVAGEDLYAATDEGLYKRAGEDGWTRIWPEDEEPRRVNAVLVLSNRILFGAEEGLFSTEGAGAAIRVSEGAVVSLSEQEAGPRRLWTGFRGEPLLLVSEDGGDSWNAAGREVGLNAVNDLVAGPDGQRLSIGGGGLDDGEGTAGVMTSEDGGESWQSERNRLSNTPVLSLELRRDPLTVEFSLPPLFEAHTLSIPVEGSRFYAGTNGTGIYTYREPGYLLSFLGGLRFGGRLLEPLLVGLVVLVATLVIYYRRRRPGERPARRRVEKR